MRTGEELRRWTETFVSASFPFHVDRRLGGLGIVSPANTYSSGVLGFLELVDLRELVDQAQCHGNPAENSSRHLFHKEMEKNLEK